MLLEFHEDVPSNEGLTIGLDVSVLYKVNAKSVRDLYITVGSDYRKVLVQPEIRSAIRDLTGSTSAKSLYSEGREGLSKGALKELNTRLNDRGVIVEQVMLRGVHLPEQLQQAIQAKLQSEQESQRMEFVLLKEKQEAQRKGIEAQGISDFQQIVSQGISEQLLQWKGIEATEKLAMSDNAKIVMFGNPANGLPTILGGMLGSTGGFTGPKVTSPLVTKGTQTAQNNEQVLKTGSDSTDASAPSTSSARKLLEEA